MADDQPVEIKTGDKMISRSSDYIRFKVAKLLVDFYPSVQTCERMRELDNILLRARDMFVPDAKQLLNELPDLEEHETACDSDQPDTREAEEEEPRAEGETSAVGEYEVSETVPETRPPPPTNACKRPRERSPAPAFRQWAVPMILSHEHIMAMPPGELVGRLVRLWRPNLGLLSGHAYARVLAYEPELDLHLLSWMFDESVQEEVCFRVMNPSAAQLVVQHPTAAFMASLERHQCKKRRV